MEVMAQLSRPFQIALVLLAALVLAWFTVLRSHASTGGSGSSGASSASTSSTQPKAGSIGSNEGKPTAVYHGSVPGLHGLSEDIRRAHETVGASESEAQKAEGKAPSTQTTAGPASSTSSAASVPAAKSTTAASKPRAVATKPASTAHKTTSAPDKTTSASRGATGSHALQHASNAEMVGGQLHSGKIVLLLFWNPHSSSDQAVHSQVQAAGRALKGKVALDFAKASEVSSFGTVTRDVSILQTPTLLIINRKGLTTTIAGLTDAFSIEQAVREAGG
jgi:hypothetical protein